MRKFLIACFCCLSFTAVKAADLLPIVRQQLTTNSITNGVSGQVPVSMAGGLLRWGGVPGPPPPAEPALWYQETNGVYYPTSTNKIAIYPGGGIEIGGTNTSVYWGSTGLTNGETIVSMSDPRIGQPNWNEIYLSAGASGNEIGYFNPWMTTNFSKFDMGVYAGGLNTRILTLITDGSINVVYKKTGGPDWTIFHPTAADGTTGYLFDSSVTHTTPFQFFANNGTNTFGVPTTNGPSGQVLTTAGNGTGWYWSAGGTTINPTDNYVPHRTSATGFGDSPFVIRSGEAWVTNQSIPGVAMLRISNTNQTLRIGNDGGISSTIAASAQLDLYGTNGVSISSLGNYSAVIYTQATNQFSFSEKRFFPGTSNLFSLGTAELPWKDLYLGTNSLHFISPGADVAYTDNGTSLLRNGVAVGGGIVPPWTNIAGVLQPNGVGANTNAFQIYPNGSVFTGFGFQDWFPDFTQFNPIFAVSSMQSNGPSSMKSVEGILLDDVSYAFAGVEKTASINATTNLLIRLSVVGYGPVANTVAYLEVANDAYGSGNNAALFMEAPNALDISLFTSEGAGTELNMGELAILRPTAPDGTTPYTFDTSLHHTSGNLFEVKNFSTNKWTADFAGNTVQAGSAYVDTTSSTSNRVFSLVPGSGVTFTTNGPLLSVAASGTGFIADLNGKGTNLFLTSSAVGAVPLSVRKISGLATNLFEITNSAGAKLFTVLSNGFLRVANATVNDIDNVQPGPVAEFSATWANALSVVRTGLVVNINDGGSAAGSKLLSVVGSSGVVGLNIEVNGNAEMDGPLVFRAGGNANSPVLDFGTLTDTGFWVSGGKLVLGHTATPLFQLTNNLISVFTNMQSSATISATNGFASFRSNLAAPTAITFPASGVGWTNTTGANIEVYIDNVGITGTAISKNGGQILGGIVLGYTMLLQPGEYFSETYSIGTPSAKYSPF